jgi:hypothetical protein
MREIDRKRAIKMIKKRESDGSERDYQKEIEVW